MQSRHPPLLHPWLAEFRQPETEATFQQVERPTMAREVRRSLFIGSLVILLFGINDYTALGLGKAFYWLFGLRLVVGFGTMGFALSVRRYSQWLLRSHWPLTGLLWLICTFSIAILAFRPETVGTQYTAIIVVSILIYLYIPNRLLWQTGINLYLALGFLAGCLLFTEVSGGQMIAISSLLLMVNLAGFMTSQSMNRLRREQFAALMELRQSNRKLRSEIHQSRRLQRELQQMAQIDHLTGLFNRRHFLERAEEARQRCQTDKLPMSLCMLDLDHFKNINDQLGHAAGDAALREIARLCQAVLRDDDVMGRLGGEEFVVALPGTDQQHAVHIAERLRQAIAGMHLPDYPQARLTATFGVAQVDLSEDSLEPALIRADRALYIGKAAGRNQVVEDH